LPRNEENAVIRKAISCDICGTEKRQTNHWFVAYEQAGELRLAGWSSRHRLRPDSKHLCGQTCLHKLVDEFMAKSIAVRSQRAGDELEVDLPTVANASLTSAVAYEEPGPPRKSPGPWGGEEPESSARLLTPPVPIATKTAFRPQPELLPSPPRQRPGDLPPIAAEPPRYASRSWHAEAWERERERELRAVENRPDIATRRHSSA
jgi:hypothetical protein